MSETELWEREMWQWGAMSAVLHDDQFCSVFRLGSGGRLPVAILLTVREHAREEDGRVVVDAPTEAQAVRYGRSLRSIRHAWARLEEAGVVAIGDDGTIVFHDGIRGPFPASTERLRLVDDEGGLHGDHDH